MTMATVDMTTDCRKPIALRHEQKHQISLAEDLVLSQRLRRMFAHDGHAGDDGTYRVVSLYFDDPYDRALTEKINGTDRREKFRLRYYGDDLHYIRLEKKIKINGLCGKRSESISEEQVLRLLAGDFRFLACGGTLFKEFYSKIRGQALAPKTIVCYDREAFVFRPANVRVTIDRNIRSGLHGIDFLRPDGVRLSVNRGISVLEVKYDEFLPNLVRAVVQVPGRRAEACSKYALCRRFD